MRYSVVAALLVLFVGAPAAVYWLKFTDQPTVQPSKSSQASGQRPRGGGGRRGQQLDGPAPVTVASVSKRSVPVYREGIGNVQPLNAVIVRSQVDGRLMSLAFEEGQNVRKGDVLARID